MKPLPELDARGVGAVLFDIDDTLTTAGKLTAEAYGALEVLQRAGKRAAGDPGDAGVLDALPNDVDGDAQAALAADLVARADVVDEDRADQP